MHCCFVVLLCVSSLANNVGMSLANLALRKRVLRGDREKGHHTVFPDYCVVGDDAKPD